MKKVLIVGKNSYIGDSFFAKYSDVFDIAIIDSMKPLTKELFVGYDAVIHLAGIAHVSTKRNMRDLYLKVNRDLAIQSCDLSYDSGCKQFIFMSSMIIYGDDKIIGKDFVINDKTEPHPSNFYGLSKLEADNYVSSKNDSLFKTLVIRSPMVYGDGSKGNYSKLMNLSLKLPFVPLIKNKRSVISIDNLCLFFKNAILNEMNGITYPQDPHYFCTSTTMENNRKANGLKTHTTRIFNPLIIFLSLFSSKLRKMFGTKIYEIGCLHEDGVKY